MRTLDEAIKHCEEVAQRKLDDACCMQQDGFDEQEVNNCIECSKEHEQLAVWLRELKDRRLKEVAEQDKADAEREALREAHRLDDNEDTLAYRGRI